MEYIFDNDLYPEDDIEICTIAAAAGQLDALIWLREVRKLPIYIRQTSTKTMPLSVCVITSAKNAATGIYIWAWWICYLR